MTEQEFAERNRREFTANVSHELKTPLQGIIGSAELIENGMVKPEDLPRFVGHIHAEAAAPRRRSSAISSACPSSTRATRMPTEPVDLLAAGRRRRRQNLHDAAAAQQRHGQRHGRSPAVMPGVASPDV